MPTTITQPLIPDWLRPLFERQAGVGMGALGSLAQMLGGENFGGVPASNLIAGFTPAQQEAFDLAMRRARGEGGFIPTAQQTFLDTARGQSLDSFIPESALSALTGLSGSAPTFSLDPTARSTLEQTAGGDFLFGGQGFDQAVDAAVRSAQPHLLSRFGAAGAGGGTGGLAQTAIAQAGIDAFASQFGQERSNQLSAAQALGGFGLNLDQLGLQGRGQQLSAAGTLAGLGGDERNRQLMAAGLLPSLATADADIMARIGATQQEQAQRELTAPIDALLRLLDASGSSGLGSLVGQSQNVPTDRNRLLEGLGAATSLLDLGQGLFGDGGLFGGNAEGNAAEVGGAADASAALGTGGAAAGAGLLGGGAAPAGTVSITEGAALADLLGSGASLGGLGGLGGLVAGAQPGIAAGIGGTAAAGQAALLGGAAPTLAPLGGAAAAGAGSGAAGAGAALGGGASADAAAGLGAAGGLSAGALAGLGIAALPAIFAATTPFGDEIHDQSSQAARANQVLGTTPITATDGRQLLMLPDGQFIDYGSVRRELGNRFGKEPLEATLAWLMSHPRESYRIPTLPGRQLPRGGNPRSQD